MDDGFARAEDRAVLGQLLETLPARHAQIVALRFCGDLTQDAIARASRRLADASVARASPQSRAAPRRRRRRRGVTGGAATAIGARSDEAAEEAPKANQQTLEEPENAGEQSADRPS